MISETDRLLLQLLNFTPSGEGAADLGDQWVWDELLNSGQVQELIPLLYWEIRQRGLGKSLPHTVSERLYLGYRRNVARTTLLLRELKLVLKMLNDLSITPVLLKGAITLALPIYPCSACRWMSDLDLLIKKEQQERANRALQQRGYFLQPPERQDCLTFRRKEGIGDIELHFSPLKAQYRSLVDISSFWSEAEEVDLEGMKVLVPSPEDQIWHRILHDLFPHASFTASPATTLYEVGRIISYYQGRIDWEKLISRAKKHHLNQVLGFLLFLLREDLGLPLPGWLSFPPAAERWRAWIWDERRGIPKSFICARNRFNLILMNKGGVWGKLKAAYRTLILNCAFREPREFLLHIYKLNRFPFLTPLVRLFHCLKMLVMHAVVTAIYVRFRIKADR